MATRRKHSGTLGTLVYLYNVYPGGGTRYVRVCDTHLAYVVCTHEGVIPCQGVNQTCEVKSKLMTELIFSYLVC